MKPTNILLAIALLLTAGCTGNRQSTDGLVTIDVSKKDYPNRELILQDFMDVEYIPLETNDDFVTQGFFRAAGKNVIIVSNYLDDGDILIFDRHTGKALKKINRKGQGGEEYTHIQNIVLDEERNEIFVNDHYMRKILVYDLDGNFKRSLKEDDKLYFFRILNFDRDNLICNNDWEPDRPPFMLVSKQDGRMTEIPIPFKEKKTTAVQWKDKENKEITYAMPMRTYNPIVPATNHFILVETSADTIYKYQAGHSPEPVMARTPSVQSMDPEVFLFISVATDRYYFMETVKKEYNPATRSGFPNTDFIYDRQEKTFYKYTVYNGDYSSKDTVPMKWSTYSISAEIPTWRLLEAEKLVDAYSEGKLKGRLKEIAATLDEDSNPVIMLAKLRIEN